MNGNPHAYLIIECGPFGSRAAEKLLKKDPYRSINFFDRSKRALQKVCALPFETVIGKDRSYLDHSFWEGRKGNYIIVEVPFPLAFKFILSELKPLDDKKGSLFFWTAQPRDRQNG